MEVSRAGCACIPDGTLAAFAEGQVDPQSYVQIEGHLADCEDCRAVLAQAAGASRAAMGARGAGALEPGDRDLGDLSPGTRIGRYVVAEVVGRGAMGTVYEARDPDLARKVAIKVLRPEACSDAARYDLRARLLREAQAMARLSHPEVITVYDVGSFGDQLFVAMEYVDGGTLRRWRGERHRSFAEIIAIYERAASGLAAAHESGLVHRDFKPDNVLVGRDGRVRVTDFGLARAVDDADIALSTAQDAEQARESDLTMTLTRTGTLLGTPAYMSLEQLYGGTADSRSDVFSFSVALYEALYGERPFAGATLDELRAAIGQGRVRAVPMMTAVPAWVRAALLVGLRAKPEERFASMRALLDALRANRIQSRRRARWRGIGIAASAFGVLGALLLHSRSSALQSASHELAPPPASPAAMAPLVSAASPASPALPRPDEEIALAKARAALGSGPTAPAPSSTSRLVARPKAPSATPPVSAAHTSPDTGIIVPAAPTPTHSRGRNGAFILE